MRERREREPIVPPHLLAIIGINVAVAVSAYFVVLLWRSGG